MCPSCDPYDTEVIIRGPGQLRRLVAKLHDAVRSDLLRCIPPASDDARMEQTPFTELDFAGEIPDVMIYDFKCYECGADFGLKVETYHGQGGTWSKL